MLPFETLEDAEIALGRGLTSAERLWFNYSSRMDDLLLYCHAILFLLSILTLTSLPLIYLEFKKPKLVSKYKLQPKVRVPFPTVLKCYKDAMIGFIFVLFPLQMMSYPTFKQLGMRTGLPLPSWWEISVQLLVYFIVEDFMHYWFHRLLHTDWGYAKIHYVHHEFQAPFMVSASYLHWAEVALLSFPWAVGPMLVPCHMVTYWLWIIIRQIESMEVHTGYDFPDSVLKCIPFFGGSEFHDYHHYVGRLSKSNFASVFTYCDYIYETDKGYRYHKEFVAKMKKRGKEQFREPYILMENLKLNEADTNEGNPSVA